MGSLFKRKSRGILIAAYICLLRDKKQDEVPSQQNIARNRAKKAPCFGWIAAYQQEEKVFVLVRL